MKSKLLQEAKDQVNLALDETYRAFQRLSKIKNKALNKDVEFLVNTTEELINLSDRLGAIIKVIRKSE